MLRCSLLPFAGAFAIVSSLGGPLAAQPKTGPEPDVQALVARLDLQRYKATIESLSRFGDRRQADATGTRSTGSRRN